MRPTRTASAWDWRVDAMVAYYTRRGTDGTDKNVVALREGSADFNSERVKANPEIAQHLADAFVRTVRYVNMYTPEEIAGAGSRSSRPAPTSSWSLR